MTNRRQILSGAAALIFMSAVPAVALSEVLPWEENAYEKYIETIKIRASDYLNENIFEEFDENKFLSVVMENIPAEDLEAAIRHKTNLENGTLNVSLFLKDNSKNFRVLDIECVRTGIQFENIEQV